MRFAFALACLSAPSALAFPWMAPEGMAALLNHPEARQEIDRRLKEHEKRQLGTGAVSGAVKLLGGTLDAVLDNVLGLIPTNKAVQGLTKFPEGMSHLSQHFDPFRR